MWLIANLYYNDFSKFVNTPYVYSQTFNKKGLKPLFCGYYGWFKISLCRINTAAGISSRQLTAQKVSSRQVGRDRLLQKLQTLSSSFYATLQWRRSTASTIWSAHWFLQNKKPDCSGFTFKIYYSLYITLLIISLAIMFSARKPVGVRLTVLPS